MPSRMWAGGAAALSPIRACANSFMHVFSRVFGHGYKLSAFLCSQRRNLVCYLFQPLYASNLLGRGIEVKVYSQESSMASPRLPQLAPILSLLMMLFVTGPPLAATKADHRTQ